MNNATGGKVGKITLTVFGGAVTEMAPSDLPEGASPFNQDCDFLPGSVFSRGGRQNVVFFANLFQENLDGVALSVPGTSAPNEQAWITPGNAALNIPGTYATAILNAGVNNPGTPFDTVGVNTGNAPVGSTTASVTAQPSNVPEVAILLTTNVVTSGASMGAPSAPADGTWTNIFGSLAYFKVVNSATAVSPTQAITGGGGGTNTQRWISMLGLFGSNGGVPAFQVGSVGNQQNPGPGNVRLLGGAFTPTVGSTLLCCIAITQSAVGFGTHPNTFSIQDSAGNTGWTIISSAANPGSGGGDFAQIFFAYCANPKIQVTQIQVTQSASDNLAAGFNGITGFVGSVTNVAVLTPSPSVSQALKATNFNFNLPITQSVTGVQVELFGHQTTLSPDAVITANLINADGSLSPIAIAGQLPLVDGISVLGTPTTGWSIPIQPAALNNPTFGVQLVARAPGGESASFFLYAAKLKVFLTPNPPRNFNWIKNYEQQTSGIFTLALDAAGILWQEDASNNPGQFSSIYTAINQNTFAKGVTFQNTEYIALSDLVQGTDMPRQWTGTNLDRVSRSGPAVPPSFATTSTGGTVLSIRQNTPIVLVQNSINPNAYLLVSAGPGAHGTFGTPSTPGNVMSIFLQSTDIPPAYFKAGTNIQLSGFPPINGFTVNNDPTGVSNPAYYTISTVGQPIPGQNAYVWITFQVPFTTFSNPRTPAGCQIQSTQSTLTMSAQVPYLEVGNQFTLTGVTPAGWNNSFTVLQTPNAAVLSISQTLLTGNVAQYVYTLVTGTAPVVGQYITVTGTLNGNGVFNIVNAVITSVSPNSFSVSIQSPNVNAAAENNSFGSIYGTVFIFDPAGTVTNPIIGNAGATGTIATTGIIGIGIRKAVVMFKTRNGAISAPSPFTQFNITATASAMVGSNIPIGGPDVVARIIAFTGAGGGNYFYIQQPVTVTSNGQQLTYGATVINDNVTTQATFSFPDALLLSSTAIDVQGNNLFAQLELGSCRGFLTYADRLIAWGVNTYIFNMLGLSFDAGIGVQNLQQLSIQPAVATYPLGWTVDSVNGAGGSLLTSPLFGNSYYVKNQTGGVQALYGMLTQPAYVTQLGTPIVLPSTQYSARITARCPSGAVTGNLVVDFFSPTLNQSFGSFSVPLVSMTSNFQIFTGALLTNAFGATTGVPKDLVFRVYLQNVPNLGDVEIDRIEPYITNQPAFATQFFASYAFNQEAFDGVTGLFGPAQNQQRVNGGMVLYDTLYMLKENSWFSTSDNGVTEPYKWNWRTVSDKIGTIGIHSYDYGESWGISACRAGLYFFEGGEPIKISQEIQTLWDLINWKYGHTIWVRNDEAAKTIKIGVPLPTPNIYCPEFPVNANPTTPNVVLNLSYRELNTGVELAHTAPIRSTFSGRLMSPEPARKWSFWNIRCPYADMIDRGSNSKTMLYCTGYQDSKIFALNPTQLSDDGVAINSFYLTHGFPKPESAEARGIDVLRSQFDYLEALVSGSGTLNTLIFPEDPQNPPYILDTVTLDAISQGANEFNVNLTGNYYYIRMGTNAVGAAFKLSTIIGAFSPDPWAPVRGTARGAL